MEVRNAGHDAWCLLLGGEEDSRKEGHGTNHPDQTEQEQLPPASRFNEPHTCRKWTKHEQVGMAQNCMLLKC
jgi:hypothetical protein